MQKKIYANAAGRSDEPPHICKCSKCGPPVPSVPSRPWILSPRASLPAYTFTLRRNSAAASGSMVLMNMPEPSSKPATRVSRGMTLRYQW